MKYEKPQVIDAGMAEGVYMASGDCDCFTVEAVKENPTAAYGGYWLEYEIHRNADHTHSVPEDWANLCVEITFNMDIPATVTLKSPGTVSGNKVIVMKETVVPANAGDWSYESVQLAGEGSENLRYVSIVVTHY